MNNPPIILEVCIESLEDAIIAQQAGAHRVELNAALMLGGLTPSLGTLIAIKKHTTIKTIVMIRPRAGGFHYSKYDFQVMQEDIQRFDNHQPDGYAFGCLKTDGSIDLKKSKQLISLMPNKEIVFHRAFDVTPDPFTALEQLIDLGVHRVMTSGQQASAYNGAPLIKRLIQQADGRIQILPAGKINRFTVNDVIARTHCNQIHGSLRTTTPDPSTQANPTISFGGTLSPDEQNYAITSHHAIASLLSDCQQP